MKESKYVWCNCSPCQNAAILYREETEHGRQIAIVIWSDQWLSPWWKCEKCGFKVGWNDLLDLAAKPEGWQAVIE